MADFKNDTLDCSFSVPDSPTVRQLLRYDSEVELNRFAGDTYERLWGGVKHLATDWKCPHVLPDANLDEIEGLEALHVIEWAGLAVWSFVYDLKHVPKNS